MSNKNHHRVLAALESELWAITPEGLEQIIAIAQGCGDLEAVAAKLGGRLPNTRNVQNRDGVAVIPVIGPIFRYANVFTEISGATSIQTLATDFSAALADPAIKAIVLEVDSPGGMAAGVSEFAAMVRAGTAKKPVVAYVSNFGASAGYWIPSAAQKIVVADTAMLGSIGMVLRVGITKDSGTVEIVSSQSPFKRVDASTDDGRDRIQATVDAMAAVFVESVARYRGVSVDHVLFNFGQGSLLVGRDAVQAGLADQLGSLESTIKQLQSLASNGGNPPIPSTQHSTPQAPSAMLEEQHLRAEWARNPHLQNEFGEFSTFLAYKKAEATGKVRVQGGTAGRVGR